MSAWGTSMLQELNPKIRTDSAITQSESGRLVDGDRVARRRRTPKKKRLPALGAGLDGRGVEALAQPEAVRSHR